MNWTTNCIPDTSKTEHKIFGNATRGMNVNKILNKISPMIQALAFNYKSQNNIKDLKSLDGIRRLLGQK